MQGLREINAANAVETAKISLFDQPFPNLATREIVREIVEGIWETIEHTHMTTDAAGAFALGVIRGARIVADKIGDDTTRLYVATLLDTLKNGGLPAIADLIKVVNGNELPAAAA